MCSICNTSPKWYSGLNAKSHKMNDELSRVYHLECVVGRIVKRRILSVRIIIKLTGYH